MLRYFLNFLNLKFVDSQIMSICTNLFLLRDTKKKNHVNFWITYQKFQSQLDSKCGTSLQKKNVMKQKSRGFSHRAHHKREFRITNRLGGQRLLLRTSLFFNSHTNHFGGIALLLHMFLSPVLSPVLYKTGVLRVVWEWVIRQFPF